MSVFLRIAETGGRSSLLVAGEAISPDTISPNVGLALVAVVMAVGGLINSRKVGGSILASAW